MKQIVIMPGGFHPFHAGHYALYKSALEAFPQADVYVAATNDQSERPFPFSIKEKLAKLAGVQQGRFVQVKSPFQAKEITQNYDPNSDVLIFVRSEKDKNESPKPGGTKKDGSPAYFQPWTGKDLQPFSKHAYFAYLPTVTFGPGIKSATEIRNAWPKLDDRRKTAMVMSLYPATQKNPKLAQNVVQLLDIGMGGQLNEFAPGNGDDGLPYAEFVVYQCDPTNKWEFMGRPLYQTDNLGMAHKYAYEMYVKHRPKAFIIYQPHAEASRGHYGVKGQSDSTEVDEGVAEGYQSSKTTEQIKFWYKDAADAEEMAKAAEALNVNGMYDETIKKYKHQAQISLSKANSLKQGVAESYSNTTFQTERRRLNVPALIKAGALFVTYPHGEQGWETDNQEDWAYSLISLYNVMQGGWPGEAKKYLKPASYKKAEQQINSSAPNLGSDKLVYDGKYNQILWSIKKLGIPDNIAFLDGGQQGVAEGYLDDEDNEPPYHTRILDRQNKKVIADDGPYESENEAVDRAEAYLTWAKTKDMSIVAQVYQPEHGKNYVTWQVPDGGDYTVKEQGVAEGAPIVVALPPIDVRNPKKAPQPYRNQGDIVPDTKPPSTEKRGVKGRPGQRPMPTYESLDYLDEK
jgi:hypothetical protein